jgi:hypothetical protein
MAATGLRHVNLYSGHKMYDKHGERGEDEGKEAHKFLR